MKRLLAIVLSFLFSLSSYGQDQGIIKRIFFFGDAGVLSPTQTQLISDASNKIMEGKSFVFFLGNNIYPRGVFSEDTQSVNVLRSQFGSFKKKGTPVYFLPGNRDWDHSGPEGMRKLLKQESLIDSLADSLVQFVPENGCPDPVAIPVADQLTVIVLDSEWWLFPFDKKNPEADCGGLTQKEILGNLLRLFYENKDKTILLAMHHPLVSYGTHGGEFTLKDHLFPLTAVHPSLYLPLPLVGSLYPLFRKAFPEREDLKHPAYKNLIDNIELVFKDFPNLTVLSSHDNGLQLIEDQPSGITQVVTGIGNVDPKVYDGAGSLFQANKPGYVIADWLLGGKVRFSFYSLEDGQISKVFEFEKTKQSWKGIQDSVYAPLMGDSLTVAVNPNYNKMSGFGHLWFGKNYREEWALPAKLPVFHLDTMKGGLKPEKLGGGHQTTSMRLINPEGTEYVMRSVDKSVNLVVPEPFQGTFLANVVSDATSAQHPYSALMVPPLAHALGVPHAHPQIGVVAPDPHLGVFQSLFVGKVNLFEEREPLGKSKNYVKAMKKLHDDNDNTFDAINFLKARSLDLLIGDWDRHGDQWRFFDLGQGKDKDYLIVPRDRDMALNVTQGIIPYFAKRFLVIPHVYGFKKNLLPGSYWIPHQSGFLNAYPDNQIGYDQWENTIQEVQSEITDSVLRVSVDRLPKEINTHKKRELLETLKARRDQLPMAMKKYYRLINKIVDIRASDKHELVSITGDEEEKSLHLLMRKISKKDHLKQTLISKAYPASLTKEIRLYLSKGDDSVVIDNPTKIRLRIIGGKGNKSYTVVRSRRKIKVYDRKVEHYRGDTSKLRIHISKDTSNLHFVPTNLESTYIPLLAAGYNRDDGVLLGFGVQFTQQKGFRKTPYTALHKLSFTHAFSTHAFHFKYSGLWPKVVGRADLFLQAEASAPENTQNFFGVGNETSFDKVPDYKRYYRARFSLYQLTPSLRWDNKKGSVLSIGPSAQYYSYSDKDNLGRLISQKNELHSFDSVFVEKDKWHLGVVADYELDRRNNTLLPAYGYRAQVRLQGFAGMSSYSRSFAQISPEFSFYKNLNEAETLILSDRIGGAATVGKPAFYQYAYLGGQGNLLGYRKFRFSGMHSLYNNLEMRLVLANFGNYIVRGQIGINGFYDVGRVWAPQDHSNQWHQGIGGGVYLAPAAMTVIRFDVGHSSEGWSPYVSIGLRF